MASASRAPSSGARGGVSRVFTRPGTGFLAKTAVNLAAASSVGRLWGVPASTARG